MLISVKILIAIALKFIFGDSYIDMKILLLFICLLFSHQLLAQNLSGIVKDATTRLPIQNAQIITSSATVLTDQTGKFNVASISIGSKIAIRILGYETLELIVSNQMLTDSARIYLKQSVFTLKEVAIQTKRNYKNDSLRLRKEYAAVFAYKPPDFTDMFIKVDPSYRSPFANINPNSTASILKFNVLSAFSLFGKKNKSTAKFKSLLVKDEEANYVDQLFSKEKVQELTKLEGNDLADFMNKYRPSILDLKKMTGYEMVQYIKKSYAEFSKP